MEKIGFNIIAILPNGSYHIQLIINNKDCGVLYLNKVEYILLSKIMQNADEHILCKFLATYPKVDYDE